MSNVPISRKRSFFKKACTSSLLTSCFSSPYLLIQSCKSTYNLTVKNMSQNCAEKRNLLETQTTGKRKKSRKLPKDVIGIRVPHNFIMIPNTDVRYSYPRKYASFLNNGDSVGFKTFLQQHCVKNVMTLYRYDGDKSPVGTPRLSKLKTVDELATVYESVLVIYPDYVFKVSDTMVMRDPQSRRAYIRSTYNSSFTKLFEANILTSKSVLPDPPPKVETAMKISATGEGATETNSQKQSAVHSDQEEEGEVDGEEEDEEEEDEDEHLDVLIDYLFREQGGDKATTDPSSNSSGDNKGDPTIQLQSDKAEIRAPAELATATRKSERTSSSSSSSSSSAVKVETVTHPADQSAADHCNVTAAETATTTAVVTKKKRRKRGAPNEVDAVTTEFNADIDEETKSLTSNLLPVPKFVSYDGKLAMHLNSDGKIVKIVYLYKLSESIAEGFSLL